MNVGLVAAAQAVEHYEITRYGALIAWAGELGRDRLHSALEGQSRRGEGDRPEAHADVGAPRSIRRPTRSPRNQRRSEEHRAPQDREGRRAPDREGEARACQETASPRMTDGSQGRHIARVPTLWSSRASAAEQRLPASKRLTWPCPRMSRRNPNPGNRVSLSRRTVHAGRTRIHEGRATPSGAGISRAAVPVLQCHDVGDQTGWRDRPPPQSVRLQLPCLRPDVATRTASSRGGRILTVCAGACSCRRTRVQPRSRPSFRRNTHYVPNSRPICGVSRAG